jgi:peptidoglycan/xylan/chitin deacetylase (PgdA/CDA1 family)
VALTLDACMGGADERILGELVADHVPATIFVTGRWLRHNAAAVKLLLAHPDLFELEDHGENHIPAVIGSVRPYGLAPAGTVDAVAHEVMDGRADLERAGGGEARWYRGATALYSTDALELIAKLGLRVAGFSLNGELGASVSEHTAARRIEAARDGDVIISHVNQPGRPAGAGVVEGVHALVAKGYHFVRLEDVAEIGG